MNFRELFARLLSSFVQRRRCGAVHPRGKDSQMYCRPHWISIFARIIIFILFESLLYCFFDKPTALFFSIREITHPSFFSFFQNITILGLSKWYLIPCGLVTIFCAFLARGKDVLPSYRRLFAYVGIRTFLLFITLSLSGIIADIIKPIVGRARPHLWLQDAIYGFTPFTANARWNSFPSGHATTAFALAFSLSFLYPRLRPLWLAYAFLIAASRVVIDAHYLSDVCAGAFLAWLTVHLFLKYGMIHCWKVIFPIDTATSKK